MIVECEVRLIYAQRLLKKPLLHGLIRRFDVQPNILEAQVGEVGGWLLLSIRGEELHVLEGLEWLRQEGVQVEVLSESEEQR